MLNSSASGSSVAKDWLRALEQTAQIDAYPDRTLPRVIAALADTATGVAFSIHEGQPVASATVDLDIKFIKSAKHGTLVARPKVLRRGNRLGFVECEIRDDEDNLIAKASGTFAILNA